MKVRRQGGATLGLVAAVVFFVIVIGVGFYFLSKIIGGGREVANATDAGALNVAKQALKRGTVTLNAAQSAEFGALTNPPGTGIVTLITYNRIVAQAMMVAQNAAIEVAQGAAMTPAQTSLPAQANAVATANNAKSVGNALKASLVTATTGTLPGDFNTIAGVSNTKMWNGNVVSCTAISTGYLKAKGSTNVIVDPNTLASLGAISPTDPSLGADLTGGPSATNSPNGQDILGATVAAGAHYLPGYDTNTWFGGAISLTGVPVFPNTKPHLVDIGTFVADLATNAAYVADANTPANSFKSNAQAIEAKSNNTAGTLACAVVGVLNQDFKASFPRGFVRINNGPDAYTQNGTSFGGNPISDGSNDIFNNQLYADPANPALAPGAAPGASGITQDLASSVFTTNPGDLTAWGAFDNRTGAYDNSAQTVPQNNAAVMTAAGISGPAWVAYNVNPAGIAYPPNTFVPQADLPTFADPNIVGPAPESISDMAANPATYDANDGGLRYGSGCNQYATLTQLEQIGGGTFNCQYWMYDASLTGPCASTSNIDNWQSNYGCISALPTNYGVASSGPNQGITNVEYLKAELLVKISGRLGGHFCADVTIPDAQPSGVKYFSHGVPGDPGSSVAFDPGRAGASPVVNFETVGTPWNYLTQITNSVAGNGLSNSMGSCGNGGPQAILEQITARMQQIESSVTQAQVQSALQSQPLHLQNSSGVPTPDNGTLYLYVDPGTHQAAMAPQLPAGWVDGTVGNSSFPDGPVPAVNSGECYDQYPLNGWVVNSQFTMTGTGKGDAGYHDQPFTQPGNASGPPSDDAGNTVGSSNEPAAGPWNTSSDNGTTAPIYGQDQAIFKASSGAQNMLGNLNFLENVQGTTFCKPN